MDKINSLHLLYAGQTLQAEFPISPKTIKSSLELPQVAGNVISATNELATMHIDVGINKQLSLHSDLTIAQRRMGTESALTLPSCDFTPRASPIPSPVRPKHVRSISCISPRSPQSNDIPWPRRYAKERQTNLKSSSSLPLTPPDHFPDQYSMKSASLAYDSVFRQYSPIKKPTGLPDWRRESDPSSCATLTDLASLSSQNSLELLLFPAGHDAQNTSIGHHRSESRNEVISPSMGPHFSEAVRDKCVQILVAVLEGSAFAEAGANITLVEYGGAPNQAESFIGTIISSLNTNESSTFTVVHADTTLHTSRSLAGLVDSSATSYKDLKWQRRQRPDLDSRIFSMATNKPFGQSVVPPKSVDIGFGIMNLQWPQSRLSSDPQEELQVFLKARSGEFKQSGLLVLAFLEQSPDEAAEHRSAKLSQPAPDITSPIPLRTRTYLEKDINRSSPSRGRSESLPANSSVPLRLNGTWSTLAHVLAPCIQRLVSCQMIQSDIARQMLKLPIHFRTAEATQRVLDSVKDDWKVEWLCSSSCEISAEATCEPALNIVHPACRAVQAGLMDARVYAEQVLHFCQNIYEPHFRQVLSGKMNRSAIEIVMDTLWQALREKVEDGALRQLEVDMTVIALRRI